MKKKLLTCFILTFVFAFSACGSTDLEEVDSEIESTSAGKKESVVVEQKVDMDELDFKRGENVYYWASTLTTGTPNELSAINSHITTLPVTEDSLNNMGEFFIKSMFGESRNGSFTEMVDFVDCNGLGTPFGWQESGSSLETENTVKLSFGVHNVVGDDLTFKRDMFDAGYWYIDTQLDDHNQKSIWNSSTSKWELFDYYIEVLGKPSYVRVSPEAAPLLEKEGAKYFDNRMNDEYIEYNKLPKDKQNGFIMCSTMINLYPVWEYDDFVLSAQIFEMFMADDDIRTSYISSDIFDFRYYPKEQWNNYWKTELGEELVDMYLYEEHGEIIDNNIPEPTPAPKKEPCVLPEGNFTPNYTNEMILEIDGKSISLLDNNSWNVVNELGLTPTDEFNYVDEDDYDKYPNGIPKDYNWRFYGYKYLTLVDKYYNNDYSDIRIQSLTIDNQHLDKIPEIKIFGLGKDSTIQDVYELFGIPDNVTANQDEDGNCSMKYGSKTDMFITDNLKMIIYVKFVENKFSYISIDFKYVQ